MSSDHMRLSKGSDSLNFSISGSVLPVKRPPHSFFGSEETAGAAAAGVACRDYDDVARCCCQVSDLAG